MVNNWAGITMQENLHSDWLLDQWPDWGDGDYNITPPAPANHIPIMHELPGNNNPFSVNNNYRTFQSGEQRWELMMEKFQSSEQRWEIMMKKINNIENNTNVLTKDVASLSAKVDRQLEDLQQVKARSLANERDIAALNKQQQDRTLEVDRIIHDRFQSMEASIRVENAKLREELDVTFSQERVKIKAEVAQETEAKVLEATKSVKEDALQDQYNSRKINLILVGLKEEKDIDDMVTAKSFFKDRMAIPDVELKVVYRLGKQRGNAPRLLLVKFANIVHRNKVWFAKSNISPKEGEKVWIQEDLPKPLKNVHRTLYRVLKKARSLGDRFPNAQIRGQTLLIDGTPYSIEELETLPEVLRPSVMATPQSDSASVFFGRFSPLSNHHPSPFAVENLKFSCMEQYLAWRRATLSGKTTLISRALKPADPIVYKGILNDLRKDNLEKWDKQLEEVVMAGLRAKFQQNPSLGRFLCNTHPREIGEASLSTKWGIGLTLVNPSVLDTSKWSKEGNLLGKKLTQVREELLIVKNA